MFLFLNKMSSSFSLIGIPSVGKSTVIDYISKNFNLDNIYLEKEPIDEWGEYFKDFLKDKKKNELSFQLKTLLSRMNTKRRFMDSGKKIMLAERSVFEEQNIFIEMVKDEISEIDYSILQSFYNDFSKYTPNFISYIYLRPDNLDFILERVKMRNQIGDSVIDENYYIDIHRRYENEIKKIKNIIIIDVNKNTTIKELSEKIYKIINKKLMIIIGGNIGSGKTTYLEQFKKCDDYNIICENIELWKNVEGMNLFNAFLENRKKYSSIFQYVALLSKEIEIIKNINTNKTIMMERSPLDDTLIFAKMLYDSGEMEDYQYKTHLSIMKLFISSVLEHFNIAYIYLNVDYKTCYDRMIKRNRPGEKDSYDINYFKKLEEYHEKMIEELNLPIAVFRYF